MKPAYYIIVAILAILIAQVAIKELESDRGMCLVTAGRNVYFKACRKP